MDDDRLRELRTQIDALVGQYVGALNEIHGGEKIHTSWVLVAGMTEIDWNDGRESLVTIHPDVPYSTRLGLLTSAKSDLLQPSI